MRFLILFLFSFQLFAAGVTDRFVHVNANSINKTLYQAIIDGDIGGGGGATLYQETPSGLINSSNVTFTLAHTPTKAASVLLFLNGLVLKQGAGLDYTISTNTITMATAPVTGQDIYVQYQ